MRVFSGCDIGRVRAENQDQVCVKSFADGILALVCDGMGGMQGGKDAGIIAAAAAGSRFTADYHEGMSEVALSELMRNMTADANHAVYLAASSANLRQRMGTTLVGVFLRDNQCWIVNVGDSRAYLLGDESIRQLTVDHTVVQLLYERGDIKAEERFAHPRRNELTRAIGVMPRVLVDRFASNLLPMAFLHWYVMVWAVCKAVRMPESLQQLLLDPDLLRITMRGCQRWHSPN